MPRFIEAKNILSTIKDSPYNIFGLKYNMNLYRGCQHGCIYCDSRSKCYQLGELSDIRIKENALVLLEKELKSKRVKGTIGFGSMNDPYMPVEKEYKLTRNALLLANRYRFPVHIITKSNLVTRDIDVLRKISNDYAAISITITAFDDNMSKEIEPGAPLSSQRFDAIKELSNAGIYTGITLMPILPYITDTTDNIRSLIMKAKECGAKYILAFMGMTIREGQREYFYKELDKRFSGLKEKYISSFRERYSCDSPEIRKLNDLYLTLCNTLDIKTKMEFYKPPVIKQLELFKNL